MSDSPSPVARKIKNQTLAGLIAGLLAGGIILILLPEVPFLGRLFIACLCLIFGTGAAFAQALYFNKSKIKDQENLAFEQLMESAKAAKKSDHSHPIDNTENSSNLKKLL